MLCALVLGSSPLIARAIHICTQLGISALRPGRFGPGHRFGIILDVPAFENLARAAGSAAAFAGETAHPVVVLVADDEPPSTVRRVVEADAFPIAAGDLDALPLLLARLRDDTDGPGVPPRLPTCPPFNRGTAARRRRSWRQRVSVAVRVTGS